MPLRELRASDLTVAGGKGANLGELIAAGFDVPDGGLGGQPVGCRREVLRRQHLTCHFCRWMGISRHGRYGNRDM